MKVLVTGAGGMVGRAQAAYCAARGDDVAGYDHHALDIANASQVNEIFEEERPEVVFNCAAWTDVGRPGKPLLWAQGYFALGDEDTADAGTPHNQTPKDRMSAAAHLPACT